MNILLSAIASIFIFWGIFLLIVRLQIEVIVSSKVQETLKV